MKKIYDETFIILLIWLVVRQFFVYTMYITYTVSGQNTIGIYITLLVLIQPTDVEQNAVNNIWLLKLQPAVKYKVDKNPIFPKKNEICSTKNVYSIKYTIEANT